MTQKQKFFRVIRVAFVVGMMLFVPGGSARAIVVDDITDSAMIHAASTLENRYHLNLQSLQDQGENLNVSSQKGQAPQVLLYFSPSDPKSGNEVEAHAFPEFFSNEKDTLYYTWYIQRKDCTLDSAPGSEKKKLCDHNDDGRITVEDWKIEAMQAIAARNFDATCSLNGSLSDEERTACAENMYNSNASSRVNPTGTKGSDSDNDGYRATFGGDGRSMFANSCSGSSSSGSTGASNDGFTPSATAGVALYASGSSTGTETSITLSAGSTFYERAVGFSEDYSEFCYEISGASSSESHGAGWCSGQANWNAATSYIGSNDQLSFAGSTWTRTVSPVSTAFPSGHTYHLFWRDTVAQSLASAKLTVGDGTGTGTSCSGHDTCYIHDFKDGYNYELPSCVHLFPHSYEVSDTGNISQVGEIGDSDKLFPIKQEHFWLTDPEDPSTAQNGTKDEANLAGLGRDTFKWTYAPGDQVGVAVEGASLYNTKYDNSSMMIMWALPKSKCDVTGKSTRSEAIKGYSVSIKTATTDIDKCLPDNLVDPTEGGQAENVELSLSATPDTPSAKLLPLSETDADVTAMAKTGDTLRVNATSSNTNESTSFSSYTWRVQASKDGTFNSRFGDQNVWMDITKDLQTAKNMGVPNGNNLSVLAINLNLNKTQYTDPTTQTVIPGFGQYFVDDVAYFRISVSMTENFSSSASRSGTSSIVVKVVANKSIDVYDVDAVKDATTGLVSVKRNATALCVSNVFQQTICPVLNNQIVGVNLATSENEIRDYAWTLNDQSLSCTAAVSSECSNEKQGSVNFFPVSGNVGDLYVLTVVANNSETGKSFTVTRKFQIVDPDFDIVSDETETAWPKYLGKYVNLDGSETSDMSKVSFEGIVGGVAKLSAIFRPESLGTFVLNGIKAGDDQNELIWSINGQPFKWDDTGLSLALDGNVGDIYTVSLSGAYNQPRELRKALYDIWRISPFSSDTERFSKEIQIQLINPDDHYFGKKKQNTFFASILSAVPPIVLFSVRLLLSLGLILLIVGVVFSVMPEEKRVVK